MDSEQDDPGHDTPERLQARIQQTLVRSVLAVPLLRRMAAASAETRFDVIIDANLDYPGSRTAARRWILAALEQLRSSAHPGAGSGHGTPQKPEHPHYMFARLSAAQIRTLLKLDARQTGAQASALGSDRPEERAIHQIWEDFRIHPLIATTIATCKADAARAAFRASGRDICWAVIDSGIDAGHPHFALHGNLQGDHATWHRDFTEASSPSGQGALHDAYGHGTHVAGIIAGEIHAPAEATGNEPNGVIHAFRRMLDPTADAGRREIRSVPLTLRSVSGMAPETRLVSLKVLEADGSGVVSSIITAIQWIQEINDHGRRLRIHGVNLSVGYPFDAEWFACGQSQLCVEVDRLVRSGVVVVVAAGNRGYGQLASTAREESRMGGLALSISDPGNAELAITVGSTHRDKPHVYGVSYFSGKGPTGDGRLKPDLLAPGEKVLSCGTGRLLLETLSGLTAEHRGGSIAPASPGAAGTAGAARPNYIEYSGTSMAAPHVSGCIAAFLSVKREFIGRPDRIKQVFMATATDLGRERCFQGAGLVDLMRAIQHD